MASILNLRWATIYKVWFVISILLYLTKAADEKKYVGELRKKTETNLFNFFRLFVFRMIYGFASMVGFSDFLEDFAGGIFAPPSAEYDSLDYGQDDYKEYEDYTY